jgi:hypothetical protein
MARDDGDQDLDELFARQLAKHREISATPNFHGEIHTKTVYAHSKPILFEVTEADRFKPSRN